MKKIVVGVDQAAGLHPDNVMVTALCGVLRGAGTSIMRPLVTTMASSETVSQVTSDSVAPGVTCDNVQVTSASSSELTSPSLVTKLCWLAALTWVTVIRCPPDQLPATGLYNAWVMIFLAVRWVMAQLRFERHPRVHLVFVNMRGERNYGGQS